MPNNTQPNAPLAPDQHVAKLPRILPIPHEFAGINMQHQEESTHKLTDENNAGEKIEAINITQTCQDS